MTEKIKKQYFETVEFGKQLFRLTVTASFLGLGTYSVLQARHGHITAKLVLLVFAGAVVGLYGFVELYKTLIRKIV